jgi:hypothetical protein
VQIRRNMVWGKKLEASISTRKLGAMACACNPYYSGSISRIAVSSLKPLSEK